MNWSKLFLSIVIVGITFFTACNIDQLDFDDIGVQDINPTVAIPLGSINYTIEELLEEINDSTVTIGSGDDQLIVLSFSDSASFTLGDEFVTIEDVTGSGVVAPNIATSALTETITIPFEQEFEFVYDDQFEDQLDSVFYEDGSVSIDIRSTCACSFNYEFVLQDTRDVDTDAMLSFGGSPTFNGSLPVVDTQSRSLRNQKTTLNSEDNTFRSTLRGEITLEVGQAITLNDEISFEFTYANQEFISIFGFFGQDTVTISGGTVDIEFFENASSEGIVLFGPTIDFEFTNSFGFPIGVLVNDVFGVNNQEDTVRLSGSVPNNAQIIEFNREDFGTPVTSNFSVSPENSNIRDLFELAPSLVEFPITGISNFGTTDGFNYLLSDSQIDSKLTFTLPLRFRLDDFEQSFDFDIDEGLDVDEVDSLIIQMVTRNNIPFRANMDLSILDNNDDIIFTSTETLVIEPPTFNALGELSSDSETVSQFILGAEGTRALKNASNISIRLVLNSPSNNVNEFFDLLTSNSLNVQVSVIGTANIKL